MRPNSVETGTCQRQHRKAINILFALEHMLLNLALHERKCKGAYPGLGKNSTTPLCKSARLKWFQGKTKTFFLYEETLLGHVHTEEQNSATKYSTM